MILREICALSENPNPLELVDLPVPSPGGGDLLVRVASCGVCHTELDEIEGRTPPPVLPVVLGHQAVGYVERVGEDVHEFQVGDRVGVAWIYSSCGTCSHCQSGEENLCAEFRATGRDVNGGYAEYLTVPAAYAFSIPDAFSDVEAAPLLCAGAIGYRSLRLARINDGQKLGLTGFGASAHLVLKMARHRFPGSDIYVFARSEKERAFARELGAVWAGDTEDSSPDLLNAIIDTTPVWKPVVEALKNLTPGGRLVINAIRKEDIDKEVLLRLSYRDHLWREKEIKSVANVTRRDVAEFLDLAAKMMIKPEVQRFPLEEANKALNEMKDGKIKGAKVLQII